MKLNFPDEILRQKSRIDKPLVIKSTSKKKGKKKEKSNDDPTYDLIRVFKQRDIAEMSDEEYRECIENLRTLRSYKVPTTAKKTPLDITLANIDLNTAKQWLDNISEYYKKEEEKKKNV